MHSLGVSSKIHKIQHCDKQRRRYVPMSMTNGMNHTLYLFFSFFLFSMEKGWQFYPFPFIFLFFFFFGSNSCNRPGKKALPWWIKYFHLKSSSRLGPNMKLAVVTSHIPFLTKICSVNFLLNSMDQIDLTQKIVWTKNCSLKLHNTEDEPKTR